MNWKVINSDKGLKGFIGYKAGMVSAYVKDNTPNSMTLGKKIVIPLTILECPTMKIFSVRFYKDDIVAKDFLNKNLDKELKKKVKLPKKGDHKIEDVKIEDYDDVKIIAYSQVKKTGIKKRPDLIEIDLSGSKEEKFDFVKENIDKEISVLDIFKQGDVVDLRGLTKGHGFSGPVKRLGIKLKQKKSEKGQRRPGSLGPWHPARVTFRAPMAGQLGMFTRIVYNNKIIDIGKSEGKLKSIKNYGDVKTDYILVRGSIQGSAKRALLVTKPLRASKKQTKKDFELIKII